MTLIGNYASKQNTSTLTNGTAIGYNAKVLQSNQVVLGNSSVTSVKTYGTITAPTIACSNLTDGYLPYHVSDASGLANSILSQSGTAITVAGSLNPTISQTTVNGITGTTVWSMPFQGSAYKKVVIYVSGFTSAGFTSEGSTITFPVAFSVTPYVYGDAAATSIAVTTTTTCTLTSVGAASGMILIEGY